MVIELSSVSELETGQVLVKVPPDASPKEIAGALKDSDELYVVESCSQEAIVLKKAVFETRQSKIHYDKITIRPAEFFKNCCWYIK